MKVNEVLMTVDGIISNELCEDIKLAKLNDVEGRVFCEILKGDPTKYVRIISGSQELSVPIPYSRMYVLYLIACIAFSKGEYERYESVMKEYEEAFCDYAAYCIRMR